MRHATQRAISMIGFWVLFSIGLAAQGPATLSGVVTTRFDGVPVPGATVSLVGTDVTTTTDAEGRYRLEIPPAFARAGTAQIKVEGLGLPARVIGVELP